MNIEIIENSPGDLRRYVVTKTTVENHQLTLMWKTLMKMIVIINDNMIWRKEI